MDNSRTRGRLAVARRHLVRVQDAWDTPTDWDNLSLYGFYCLEAAVMAAAAHLGIDVPSVHWAKADAARALHRDHGLPDIQGLLADLNQARKAAAYGDVARPDLDTEDTAREIEKYVEVVDRLLKTREVDK